MSRDKIIGAILIMLTYSCTKKNNFHEVKDKDLTIQIMQIENAPGDPSLLNYQARLIPDKSFIEQKGYQQRTDLFYKMDSCFYLIQNERKIYPVLVQAIANGVSGTFEYMLEFEKGEDTNYDQDMVYQDRYLNKKTYDLKLNKN